MRMPVSHIIAMVLIVAVGVHAGYGADASVLWRRGTSYSPGPDHLRSSMHYLLPLLVLYLLVLLVPKLQMSWRILCILAGVSLWCAASEMWALSTAHWPRRAIWCALSIVTTVAFVYIDRQDTVANDSPT